ncbi:MAG: hypothetical protein EHM40_02055 [Chloroflexi bacterium]|nr:MAG: hypothetical protein EHM40_02055 [Chloroflexota bacterium]
MELLKQALTANPDDVDAWLVVAAVVDQPERKRQCLNRVLSLDPVNQIARDELLEMDRAAMGGTPPSAPRPVADNRPDPPPSYPTSTSAFESGSAAFASNYPASTPAFESAPQQSPPVASQAQAKAAPRPASKARVEKPLVFKFPLFWRILTYVALAFFLCLGLLVASLDVVKGLLFFGLAFLTMFSVMIISPKVEVSEKGIRASGLLSSSEVGWNDIKSMKSGGLGHTLQLLKSDGQVVKVSTQVSGYPRIVEIMRQKRPDLFGLAASPAGQGNLVGSGYEQGSSVPAVAFSGSKKFEKSFLAQYAMTFLYTPVCLLAAWSMLSEPEYRVGALLLIIVCGVLMALALFQVKTIKVEPNKLTLETLFGEKDFSAREIKEIKMKTVRTRSGTARHYVKVVPVQGNGYSLAGFSEGEEIIYGFLTNWWSTYRNR